MGIRLIGLDIDHTLLNSRGIIGDRTAKALNRAFEQGIRVVPVTGRPYHGLPAELGRLADREYIITSNGATLWQKGEAIAANHLSGTDCLRLRQLLGENEYIGEYFMDGFGYESEESFANIVRQYGNTPIFSYFTGSRKALPDMDAFLCDAGAAIEEIAVMFPDAEICEKYCGILENKFPQMKAVRPMPNYLEIFSDEAGKGKALLELGRRLDIQSGEIMAFGDSDNDFEMLEKAGIAIAMGNAAPHLKESADFVTADLDHEGIAEALEKYVFGTDLSADSTNERK